MKRFKFEDVKDFDEHIFSSIPTFRELNILVESLCVSFAQDDTRVIDLGCSTGRLLRAIPKNAKARYVGIDKTFRPLPTDDVSFFQADIMEYLTETHDSASVIVSMFTMQFLPTHQREDLLEEIDRLLCDGGVFICAEKVHYSTPQVESVVHNTLLEWKLNNFSKNETLDKTLSLKTVMHCRTQHQLVEELSQIGTPDCVWAWGPFVCYVVQK